MAVKTNIRTRVAELQRMELPELRKTWLEEFAREAPDCGSTFLRRRLACRIQEKFYGCVLSDAAERILSEVGDRPKVRPNAAGILPGTRFERKWKDKIYIVTARENGFELDGKHFKTLSGAATAITGTCWSGKKFFGVKS